MEQAGSVVPAVLAAYVVAQQLFVEPFSAAATWMEMSLQVAGFLHLHHLVFEILNSH